MNLHPTSFEEYIGHPRALELWKKAVTQIKPGNIVYIYGYSGVGKTTGTQYLTQSFNVLQIDSSICGDSRDILDRIKKFHSWSILFHSNDKEKVIVIDELENFLRSDRNTLNNLLAYLKSHTNPLPVILIGDTETNKKLGEIKSHITDTIFLNRLQETDIFLYLKKRLPKNKLKLADLLQIAEDSNNNIALAIQNVEDRLKKKSKSIYLSHYKGDEHCTFNEIFSSRNPDTIARLLQEDAWMHPLKIHENSLTLLDEKTYPVFLEKYLIFEQWRSEDNPIPYDYLGHVLVHYIPEKNILPTMEFSKLLSYISTQKKYRRSIYTFEDLGRNKNIIFG